MPVSTVVGINFSIRKCKNYFVVRCRAIRLIARQLRDAVYKYLLPKAVCLSVCLSITIRYCIKTV